jgi:hypothetical protein
MRDNNNNNNNKAWKKKAQKSLIINREDKNSFAMKEQQIVNSPDHESKILQHFQKLLLHTL